jgi:hypothetical protein
MYRNLDTADSECVSVTFTILKVLRSSGSSRKIRLPFLAAARGRFLAEPKTLVQKQSAKIGVLKNWKREGPFAAIHFSSSRG